ncbi:G-type lectin S-receptor-like serine/threonine-protein kinase SD2-5 [Quercus robur]|uniref:G-type lectin S-receptor-like serine/threonine-protein kinase SD2-5 n=1 Tax=Quercus robur TaxID=38942 RepID=UPI0021632BA0|nr:G-type lectin S-receptor-like serine/threonine-protein kinase SD2-5 [Quercus robur]
MPEGIITSYASHSIPLSVSSFRFAFLSSTTIYMFQIMGVSWACCSLFLYFAFFLTPFPILVTADLAYGYLPVNSPITWTNSEYDDSENSRTLWTEGNPTGNLNKSNARIILASSSFANTEDESACGCGFFCNQTCNSSLFAIFTFYGWKLFGAEVPWSANPNNPVRKNATLKLTSKRGLVLQDADGTIAWSTNIGNKSVAGLLLTDTCNLKLLDENNATIWQSFDHPTDTLILGQKLVPGQQLTSKGGLFSLSLTSGEGMFAYINSNPPLPYYVSHYLPGIIGNNFYVQLLNQSLALFSNQSSEPYKVVELFSTPSSMKYMRFESDGHLRAYNDDGSQAYDVLTQYIEGENCGYPTFCGNYSFCSNGDQCVCPSPINGKSYFRHIDDKQPHLGCSLVTPLSCKASKNHILLELKNITYFPFSYAVAYIDPNYRHMTLENCTDACLRNCSCKAAIYDSSSNLGNCYLQPQIFSLKSNFEETESKFKLYIKVQNIPPSQLQLDILLGSSLAFAQILFIGIFVFLFCKEEVVDEGEDSCLDQVTGILTRYSYVDLQAITKNFNNKLGEGGFGTVFEGTLINNTKVAVKCLDGFGQIKKSFLAEVMTIGNIHHFNLVRLIGFCVEKSHRLLVYEYMSNGSLDKWVFHKNPEMLLDWQQRKKIIIDIARGLTYLHDDCSQKIVHLDIKPHNILLDDNFNAKVADFGLSKLVDRDQSQVVTTMRGTPGYMAPEWLSSVITEKVDVYSFGVVLLEILCGRRNVDRSQPEEAMHLLDIFKKNIEENRLLDLVDKCSEDMQLHGAEVVNMMRVAAWCLQNDFTKRPSMSMVVKVLEGAMHIEFDLDCFILNLPSPNMRAGVDDQEVHVVVATPLLPSVLSGPR